MDTEKHLNQLLADHFPELLSLGPDDFFEDCGVLDSWQTLDLIQKIEVGFNFKIPDEDLTEDNFGSTGSILRYLEKRNQ